MTCGWCGSTQTTGHCTINNTSYCKDHRNHTHTHKEIEMWVILTRTRVSPLKETP